MTSHPRVGQFVWVVTLFAVCCGIAAAQPLVLHRVSPPHGGYSVLLPTGWRFRDASYPSDHATHLWYQPSNALLKMSVVLSDCVGCVSQNLDDTKPNPRGELPQGVVSTYRISKWVLAYEAFSSDDPYPDNGMVIVTHRGARVTGSVIVGLWLPQRQHALATTILNSFHIT
jgi:hypothetical protein